MSKWPISTFLAPFDISSSRHCRETPASLACYFIFSYDIRIFDYEWKPFWSRGISETYGFTLVRPYVRPYGFSEKSAHQIFLIFLMNLWLRNRKKVTVSLFVRKFKIGPFLAKNGPKSAIFGQNSPKSVFFAHIFKVTHQIFLIFRMKPWFYKCFDLILTLKKIICFFLYEILYIEYFFNIFVCHAAPC